MSINWRMTPSRIFLFILLAGIAGILLRSFVALPWTAIGIAAFFAVAAVAWGFLYKKSAAVLLGFLVLALLCGVMRFAFAMDGIPRVSSLWGKAIIIRGIVASEPETGEGSQKTKVNVEKIEKYKIITPFQALLVSRSYPRYALGQEVRVEGTFTFPETTDGFDYGAYLMRQNIAGVFLFPRIEKIGEGKGNALVLFLGKIKKAFEARIDESLAEPHAAFLKGLLLGERSSLPQKLIDEFKRTGTNHIIAVSGYNITIVGRFFMALLALLMVPVSISFWIATAAIFLFVLLTGASASVVRAGIMGILVLIAGREGRKYHMTNALVFAGAAMVFHNPFILRFDAGFQLSFLATMGLLYLVPFIDRSVEKMYPVFRAKERHAEKKNFLLPLQKILIETFAAQLMVLPLLLYLFHQISFISPLVNILVLVAVPYAMAIGFAAGIGGFLWMPLGKLLGGICWIVLEYILRLITFFAAIPFASVSFSSAPLLLVCLLYGILIFFLFRSYLRSRRGMRIL